MAEIEMVETLLADRYSPGIYQQVGSFQRGSLKWFSADVSLKYHSHNKYLPIPAISAGQFGYFLMVHALPTFNVASSGVITSLS